MVIDLKEEISTPEWIELLTAMSHEYIHDEPEKIGETLLMPYDSESPDEGILVKRFKTEEKFMHISLEHVGGNNTDQDTKQAFEDDIYDFITDKLGYDNSY